MTAIRVAVVTISDGVARGVREDRSGPRVLQWVEERGYTSVRHDAIPDEAALITARIIELATDDCDVILTTGGTGLTARDVTPEATKAAITRDVPGISEAMRAHGAAHTPYTWLSRGVAGVRGNTLIVNLPGSESGVRDGLHVLDSIIAHAVQLLRGIETDKH